MVKFFPPSFVAVCLPPALSTRYMTSNLRASSSMSRIASPASDHPRRTSGVTRSHRSHHATTPGHSPFSRRSLAIDRILLLASNAFEGLHPPSRAGICRKIFREIGSCIQPSGGSSNSPHLQHRHSRMSLSEDSHFPRFSSPSLKKNKKRGRVL